jgi:hypothetical protein
MGSPWSGTRQLLWWRAGVELEHSPELCDRETVGERLHRCVAYARSGLRPNFGRATGATRGANDRVHPPDPPPLVLTKDLLRFAPLGGAEPEHDRILERLRGPLTDVRLHRVGGIAQQRHAAAAPAAARPSIVGESRLDRLWFGRFDQGRDGVEPGAATARELLVQLLRRGAPSGTLSKQYRRRGRGQQGRSQSRRRRPRPRRSGRRCEPRRTTCLRARRDGRRSGGSSPKSDLRTAELLPSAPTTMWAATGSAPSISARPSSLAPTHVALRRRRSTGKASSITCCSDERRMPYVSHPCAS